MKKGEVFYLTGVDEFYALVEFRKWLTATSVEVVSCTYGWTFLVDLENKEIRNELTGSVYHFEGTESWVQRVYASGHSAMTDSSPR